MTDFFTVALSRSGPAALIIVVAVAFYYAVKGVTDWRKSRRADGGAVMTDAATTNAMLLEALRGERAAGRDKDQRIDELEAEVNVLRDQLFEQRRVYENEIGELRSKLQDITLQLERLQSRIHATFPDSEN